MSQSLVRQTHAAQSQANKSRVSSTPVRTPSRRHRSRRTTLERLECRQLLDGNADDLAPLSDEFDDAATIAQWSEVHHTEGWGPRGAQFNQWTVNAGGSGQMLLQPHSVVWYEDWRGPLVFKELTGDFVVTTRMQVTDRDDVGGADADHVPGDSLFSLGGLMIRTPRAIANGAADWVPGSHSDVGNVGENYVFLSLGYTSGMNRLSFEVKTTRNSTSTLELTPVGLAPNQVELRIARIGQAVIVLHRLEGEADWTVHRRYSRPDMPATLQVGMVAYTDWEKANDLPPVEHNGSVLAPGQVVDPSPGQPFNPDVTASFDYTRFERPQLPTELVGLDLVASATDGQLLSFLGAGGSPNPEPLKPTRIGMNISGLADWDPSWMFRNAFQRARPWGAEALNVETGETTWQVFTGEGPPLAVDEHGWVAALPTWQHSSGTTYQQVATTVIYTDEARQPAGIYRAEWTGEGDLRMPYVVESGVMDDGRRYALVDMPYGAHFAMSLRSTNPADPVRDIRLWMPNYNGQSLVGDWAPGEAGSPFHPLFIERLDDFDTLRFMDLLHTNQTDVVTWDDRAQLDAASQADGDLPQFFHTDGVAPEYLIELANETGANPWFNMPYQADDDYVRHFAELVRDTLAPDLKVYVEWSNELWNGFFPTYHWLAAQTQLPENAGLDFFQLAGREMVRDFDIWTEVFTGQEDRLVRVVAGQQANAWLTEQLLASVAGRVNAVSSTAYAGIGYDMASSYTAETTADQIIDDLLNLSIPWAAARLNEHRLLVEQYEALLGRDLEFVTYESGSHVFGDPNPFPTSPALAAALAAAASPRMYDVYQTLLAAVNGAEVDLYNEFSFTSHSGARSYGSYGVLHDMAAPLSEAHKLRALLEYAAAHPEEEENAAPVLDPVAEQAVLEGALLSLQLTATDPDQPAQSLSYTLLVAPPGASLSAEGLFQWTPTALQAPGVFDVTVRVTDHGSPPRSDEATFSITVLDLPELTVGDVLLVEGDLGVASATFVVSLSAPSAQPVTVGYATADGSAAAGADYRARSGQLTFAPGVTQQLVSIPVLGDRRDEWDETFFLRLAEASGAVIADSEGLGTIVDNDPLPTVRINSVSVTEGDADAVTATLTVRLSAASNRPVTVSYVTADDTAQAGADYEAQSGALVFAPGETLKTLVVPIVGDLLDELNETLTLLLTAAENGELATPAGRITIRDNDAPPALAIDSAALVEGAAGAREMVFTVSLSAPSGRQVAVNYSTANGSAKAGVDYEAAAGTLIFEPGETTKTIRIVIFGDTLLESDETFRVRLHGAVGARLATASGEGRILNDDFFAALGG